MNPDQPTVGSANPPATASKSDPVLPKFEEASDRTMMNLAHKSAMIVDAFPDRVPNAHELEDMTRAFGVELVSMSLVKILAQVIPNRYFLERVDRVYRDLRRDGQPSTRQEGSSENERAELCVIESVDPLTPGARWGGHVETWRSWGRRAGLTTDVIQTNKKNSLLANAEIIRRELALQPHDRRVIATVGQGGAEFRLLLEQLLKTAPHELHGIQMWVNVSGLIRGGSGIRVKARGWWERQMQALSCAVRGWPSNMAQQLSTMNPRLKSEPALQGLPFVCVSMVGFPNVNDVPAGLKTTFMKMKSISPADGLAYFHEAIVRPGYVVPVPGMSHAAEPEKLGPWFQAVLSSFEFR